MSVRRFDLAAGGDTFSFKAETEDKISFWLAKYPDERKRSAVIPLLWLAQKDNAGWLSEPAMRDVAERLEMPYIRVYEVATFYTMFRLQPVGTPPRSALWNDALHAARRKRSQRRLRA